MSKMDKSKDKIPHIESRDDSKNKLSFNKTFKEIKQRGFQTSLNESHSKSKDFYYRMHDSENDQVTKVSENENMVEKNNSIELGYEEDYEKNDNQFQEARNQANFSIDDNCSDFKSDYKETVDKSDKTNSGEECRTNKWLNKFSNNTSNSNDEINSSDYSLDKFDVEDSLVGEIKATEKELESELNNSNPSSFSRKQQELQDQITFLSALQNVKGMFLSQSWTMSELIFGIKWLHKSKKKRNFSDFVERSLEIDHDLYLKMKRYLWHMKVCSFIDRKPRLEFLSLASLEEKNLVEYFIQSTPERNGYCILVDHNYKEVVLYINGTQSLNDMMIDLHTNSTPFLDGYAHHGIALWAKWFYRNKLNLLQYLLKQHEGYRLVLCGHSLGGATSVLAGFMIKEKIPDVEVIAFAVPKCISESLVAESEKFVTTFVYMDDFIPLMSECTWVELRKRVKESNWRKSFVQDISSSKAVQVLMKIAPSIHNVLARFESETEIEIEKETLYEKQEIAQNMTENSPNDSCVSPKYNESEDMIIESSSQQESDYSNIPSRSEKNRKNSEESKKKFKFSRLLSNLWTKSEQSYKEEDIELKTPNSPFEIKKSLHSKSCTSTPETAEDSSIEQDVNVDKKIGTEKDKRSSQLSKLLTTPPVVGSESYFHQAEKESISVKEEEKILELLPSENQCKQRATSTNQQEPMFEGKQISPSTPNIISLHIPGEIYYIRQVDEEWYMTRENWDSPYFEKLEFNRTFLKDHMSSSYYKGIRKIVEKHEKKQEIDQKRNAIERLISVEQDFL